jgi:large subunit ribosomal protein L15
MSDLSQLKDTSRPKKKVQRVGRGIGSKRGATSGRGGKGDSARAGYRKRFGYEGGQVPLYRKLPIRGFTRGRFVKLSFAISLSLIERCFNDGDVVSFATLREKKLVPRRVPGGIKVLGNGELTKKVTIEAHAFSASAMEKIQAKSIPFSVVK